MNAMLVAEYGKPGEMCWRRVTLDADAGTVTFEQCHIPGRILALWPEPEFTCSSADIRGTSWRGVRDVGPVIVTRQGRGRLPQSAVGFDEVRSVIEEGARSGDGLSWYEYACLGMLFSPVGLFLSVLLFSVVRRKPLW